MTFLDVVLGPAIGGFLTILGQKILEYFKTPSQSKIDAAQAKAKEIENENSQHALTKNLLDFASEQLDKAVIQIKKRDDIITAQDVHIQDLYSQLKDRNKKFDELMVSNEHLIIELSKYKQLNGKI